MGRNRFLSYLAIIGYDPPRLDLIRENWNRKCSGRERDLFDPLLNKQSFEYMYIYIGMVRIP